MSRARTPEQIRASIEANRSELGVAVERLRPRSPRSPTGASSSATTSSRSLIGAAVAGFVLGGGIAGVVGLFRRRR